MSEKVSDWFEYIDPLLSPNNKKYVRALVNLNDSVYPKKKYDIISEVTMINNNLWLYKSAGEKGRASSKEEAIFLSDLIF